MCYYLPFERDPSSSYKILKTKPWIDRFSCSGELSNLRAPPSDRESIIVVITGFMVIRSFFLPGCEKWLAAVCSAQQQWTDVESDTFRSVHMCNFTWDTLLPLLTRCHRWDAHRLLVRTRCRAGITASRWGVWTPPVAPALEQKREVGVSGWPKQFIFLT